MSTNEFKSLKKGKEKRKEKEKEPQYGKIAKMTQKKFHFFELLKACSPQGAL
jgi:hypothetical protein